MIVLLEGILEHDLRAETMKAQIAHQFGPRLKHQVKEVKVYPVPNSINRIEELKSYGFNTHFYGGEWHKSQATSILGLKAAITRMHNSGKTLTANYRRLIRIWNPVVGFNLGRHYNKLLYDEFGEWQDEPHSLEALDKCWVYLYECLKQKNIYRTDDFRKGTSGASMFWIPDKPKDDIRLSETSGVIWTEFDNRYVKLNDAHGMDDRPYIREISFTEKGGGGKEALEERVKTRMSQIRGEVDFTLGHERKYDRATR